jgi:hypothetical protein
MRCFVEHATVKVLYLLFCEGTDLREAHLRACERGAVYGVWGQG